MNVSWAIPFIVSILILGALGFSQDAFALTILSDQASCGDLGAFATSTNWDSATQTCTITGDATVNDASPDEFEFVIPDGVTLHIIQAELTGFATFTINDKVTNNGHVKMTLDLEGSVFAFDHAKFLNNDEFVNNGKISMLGEDYVKINLINNRVEFDNHGVFLNNGELEIDNLSTFANARLDFTSDGEFVNSCTGEIRLGQISGSLQSAVDISDTFENGGTYLGLPDPDISDDTVFCTTALNTINTLTAENLSLQAIIDEFTKALSTFTTAFVQPIIDAVLDIPTIADDASLTRTLERSLSTLERANGVACTGAESFEADVSTLLADGVINQEEADMLLERSGALLKTCIP